MGCNMGADFWELLVDDAVRIGHSGRTLAHYDNTPQQTLWSLSLAGYLMRS